MLSNAFDIGSTVWLKGGGGGGGGGVGKQTDVEVVFSGLNLHQLNR